MSGTGSPDDAARPTPHAALRDAAAVWRRVLSGRLVVRGHRDENGRRYLHLQEPSVDSACDAQLTERERLVIGYQASGQGLRLIAGELNLSVPTVTRSLSSGLKKLGLKNDIELSAVFGAALRQR